ncbi:hypothetical protein [Longimicrobium sp.]|uniref:hypothetical protein n=1 Tax=Longimicrobium sp. TaxID=2029185 RepID=UPI003B3A7736
MVTIQVGPDSRKLEEVTESWINEQIQRRRQDGRPTCVQVSIQRGSLFMRLSTPECASGGGGGGRPPDEQEREIFGLWEQMRLNTSEFTGGNVVAFLKRLRHLL